MDESSLLASLESIREIGRMSAELSEAIIGVDLNLEFTVCSPSSTKKEERPACSDHSSICSVGEFFP